MPTTPSASGTPSVASTDQNTRTASLSGTAVASTGMPLHDSTVTVVGTSATAAVDTDGRFSLSDLASGDVRLQIASGATAATVVITAIQPGEHVDVLVVVTGASAVVQTPSRDADDPAEATGIIDAVPPATAAGSFRLAGRLVQTTISTEIRRGGQTLAVSDLRQGQRAEVHGAQSGDLLIATRVEIQDDDAGPSPAPGSPAETEFSGTIAGLSGGATSFQFSAGGHLVKGDATTVLTGRQDAPIPFSALANGLTVEIKAVPGDGFVQAQRIHVEDGAVDDPPGDDHGQEIEITGLMGRTSGTCPSIESSVDSTRFSTNASTEFDGAACRDLKAGDRVEVKGLRANDGSITASRVRKE